MEKKKRDFTIQQLKNSGFNIIIEENYENYKISLDEFEEIEVKSEDPERAALSQKNKTILLLVRDKKLPERGLVSTDKLIGIWCEQKSQYGPGQEYLGDILIGTPKDSISGLPSTMVMTVEEYDNSVVYDPQGEGEWIVVPEKYLLYLTPHDISNE
jgi:hypothetical protein